MSHVTRIRIILCCCRRTALKTKVHRHKSNAVARDNNIIFRAAEDRDVAENAGPRSPSKTRSNRTDFIFIHTFNITQVQVYNIHFCVIEFWRQDNYSRSRPRPTAIQQLWRDRESECSGYYGATGFLPV
jgi:hypothetical protein